MTARADASGRPSSPPSEEAPTWRRHPPSTWRSSTRSWGASCRTSAAGIAAPLAVIGDKLGLYRAMADGEPVTSAELAERTGCRERYIREWLSHQAAGQYVEYEPATGTFRLPPEHAMALADETGPAFVIGAFQLSGRDDPRRAAHHGALPLGRGLRLARAPPRPLRGDGALLPAGLPRQPGRGVAAGPRRGGRAPGGRGARGRHRVRPRRLDDPDGPGVPGVHVRRVRLPRGLGGGGAPRGRARGGGRPRDASRSRRRRISPAARSTSCASSTPSTTWATRWAPPATSARNSRPAARGWWSSPSRATRSRRT